MTHHRWPILSLLALAGLLLLGTSAVATAEPAATVIAVSYAPGDFDFNVVLAIPRGIDEAARHGNADWGLQVTLTYLDVNSAVETLDSGPLSIRSDTVLFGPIDEHTDAIGFELPLAAGPGADPQYSPTAQLLHP